MMRRAAIHLGGELTGVSGRLGAGPEADDRPVLWFGISPDEALIGFHHVGAESGEGELKAAADHAGQPAKLAGVVAADAANRVQKPAFVAFGRGEVTGEAGLRALKPAVNIAMAGGRVPPLVHVDEGSAEVLVHVGLPLWVLRRSSCNGRYMRVALQPIQVGPT